MTFDNKRTFGVEIEFIGQNNQRMTNIEINQYLERQGANFKMHTAYYSDTDSSIWRLKTDSSVRGSGYGLEVVSPILRGDEGHRQLMLVLDAINHTGATINRSCGLHIHVGVSDWGIKQFRNLYKRYAKFERAIDSVMPNSRRRSNNDYCNSTVMAFGYTLGEAFEKINSCRTARQIQSQIGTRYTKLNIQSFWKHGTIEFRHHAGSTDKDKISNWLKVCLSMVQAADDNRAIKVNRFDPIDEYVDRINLMLKGLGKLQDTLIDSTTKRFFTKRRKELCNS